MFQQRQNNNSPKLTNKALIKNSEVLSTVATLCLKLLSRRGVEHFPSTLYFKMTELTNVKKNTALNF